MPYAYGSTIRHEFLIDHLNVWVTFRHPMQRSEIPKAEIPVYDWMPPLNLWLLVADAVPVDIIASEWQDQFTILLTSDTIIAEPDRVLLEYDGPNGKLQTTWGKDWEPWGPILSTDIVKFPCFVDRGDPAVKDFVSDDFVKDDNWHKLDLSGIVPAGAKAVLLAVEIVQVLAGKTFWLRKNGNVNTVNVSRLKTQVANVAVTDDPVTPCDKDRKLEYRAGTGTWPVINVSVKSWWF